MRVKDRENVRLKSERMACDQKKVRWQWLVIIMLSIYKNINDKSAKTRELQRPMNTIQRQQQSPDSLLINPP